MSAASEGRLPSADSDPSTPSLGGSRSLLGLQWLRGRSTLFWAGVGISLTVGAVVLARHLRHRLEQQVREQYGSIPDQFTDLGQVQEALNRSGLPSSELMLAIDYSADNATAGVRTLRCEHLHRIKTERADPNPYQYALFMIAKTMRVFDSDGRIPIFGVWQEFDNPQVVQLGVANDFDDLLRIYTDVTPKLTTQGSFSWKGVIDQAIEEVGRTKKYHILIVLTCGGASTDLDELRDSLVSASRCPLSIVAIGVGDGPFTQLEAIDDEILPGRLFDNFQFVNLQSILGAKFPDVAFALGVLQEIPAQYSALKRLSR